MRFGSSPPEFEESRAVRKFAYWPKHMGAYGRHWWSGRWIWFESYWEIQTYQLKVRFIAGEYAGWRTVGWVVWEKFPYDRDVIPVRPPRQQFHTNLLNFYADAEEWVYDDKAEQTRLKVV